jgi:hypothetical protein
VAALTPALHAYEGEMLAYGFKVVKSTRLMLQLAINQSRLVRTVARTVFWLCGVLPPLRRLVFADADTTNAGGENQAPNALAERSEGVQAKLKR